MPKFEVTVERTVVHVAKITVEVPDQGEGDAEDEACKAAIKLAEELHGTTDTSIEWELDSEDFDVLEAYEE